MYALGSNHVPSGAFGGFAAAYQFLEELRLKRMAVSDESMEFKAMSFPCLKSLSLLSFDGFSTDGLKSIASHCRRRWWFQLHFWPMDSSLVHALIKGRWTDDEDKKLIRLVKKHGVRKWAQIAEKVIGRAGEQCRKRSATTGPLANFIVFLLT
ncbi:hypothetical protein RJ640_007614 [Escallonia rubra]|uniref:Uncharacterized protein n=1 Tax=Escallonia rubra TaxID=112253 RepID=A0AA88UWC6_9ASTE|nr:hypothetical protein RJ640_007614 [Escallonia rubra]